MCLTHRNLINRLEHFCLFVVAGVFCFFVFFLPVIQTVHTGGSQLVAVSELLMDDFDILSIINSNSLLD